MEKRVVVVKKDRQEDLVPVMKSLKACGLVILGGPMTVYDQDTAPFPKVRLNA